MKYWFHSSWWNVAINFNRDRILFSCFCLSFLVSLFLTHRTTHINSLIFQFGPREKIAYMYVQCICIISLYFDWLFLNSDLFLSITVERMGASVRRVIKWKIIAEIWHKFNGKHVGFTVFNNVIVSKENWCS